MRPERLNPLFAMADTLRGVGPRLEKPLARLGLKRVKDVAYHLPDRFVERRRVKVLRDAKAGDHIIVQLTVVEHRASAGRAPFRVVARDEAGDMVSLTYFGRASHGARKALPVGERREVAGRLEEYGQSLQIVHPDHVSPIAPVPVAACATDGSEAANVLQGADLLCEPVYPLTDGLTNHRMQSLVAQAMQPAPPLPEWIEPGLMQKQGWSSWRDALEEAHRSGRKEARNRLAYDELLASALALMLVRADNRRRRGPALIGTGTLRGRLQLPFSLTGAQQRSIREIEGDLAQQHPMLRLLQGDVGSGKTVVALNAMLIAVEAGGQAALLAPTEILARQHHQTLCELAQGTGVEIAILTGRDKGRAREAILMGLLDGSIDIIVGTHAIFQDTVNYRNLVLVVVDEQHRFGVGQRLSLTRKARQTAHCLAMTATPIPRTLTLAQYGEMEVSRLDELPPGRKAIDTRVVALDRLDDVAAGLVRHVEAGGQAYWVCPMVHENESADLAAAEARFATLREMLGDAVALVHGQLRPEAKDAAMARFVAGQAKVLVATTVIEVGVNVPNASLMIIEQAERFGLAQLHQLRGRVGRGAEQSVCLLLRGDTLSATARDRLALMRETQDGFRLAEEDLRLRGAGELLGTRQSGDTPFRVATPEQISAMIAIAHDDARLLIDRDGGLQGPRGEAARTLLYLFERDYGVQLLRGG
ncbi:ATP-dependent DNA helicase RecG [Croceicoccus sp. F390]|uniref:Probable DNA 3'-5' helicase RecG n=1 Tax=Croceicoccus esteveae TaxID=3075597 RepID=A0ABU2ZM86_9SPHN|nr:ATP-dependent DNA helicase RecG [Croceicoccus sp. F390]MDT0576689.1 ATP-dependent DNA helicase RecG [Croceicoccus sp. F390]